MRAFYMRGGEKGEGREREECALIGSSNWTHRIPPFCVSHNFLTMDDGELTPGLRKAFCAWI